jgi:tRNA (uracil-5-)-methyltransferase TRM9
MGVKATQPEMRTSENDLDDRNGKGAEGGEGRIEEKIQDVLVPWVLRSKPKPKSKSKPKTKSHPRSGSKPPTSSPNQDEDGNDNGNTTSDRIDEKNGAGPQKEEEEEGKEEEEKEEEEEEKVFNRYYHLFIEGELRDLIHQAGVEEGYRILPSSSSSSSTSTAPLVSSTSTSTPSTTSTKNDQKEMNGGNEDGEWLRIRGEGWEADNWWVEAEVGVGDGQ